MASESVKDGDVWYAADAFFKKFGQVHHQKESFNSFLLRSVPDIIHDNMPITFGKGRYAIEMQNPLFHAPCIEGEGTIVYPMQCIEANRTYRSELSVDLVVRDLAEGLEKSHRAVSLGLFPVMVGSVFCNLVQRNTTEKQKFALRECPYDEGGYFIVKGTCKILVCQDRPMSCYNRVYVFASRKAPNYTYFAEVRSIAPGRAGRSTTVVVGVTHKKSSVRRLLISAVIPYMSDKTPIPLGVLFKALGTKDEHEMVRLIFLNEGPSPAALAF